MTEVCQLSSHPSSSLPGCWCEKNVHGALSDLQGHQHSCCVPLTSSDHESPFRLSSFPDQTHQDQQIIGGFTSCLCSSFPITVISLICVMLTSVFKTLPQFCLCLLPFCTSSFVFLWLPPVSDLIFFFSFLILDLLPVSCLPCLSESAHCLCNETWKRDPNVEKGINHDQI